MFVSRQTLLLVTRQMLARIDFAGSKVLRVDHVWTTEAAPDGSFASEVTRAIRLGNKPIRKATIVSPDFWSGMIALPSDVAAFASSDEIEQAVAFEAEMESGLSALEAHTRCIKVGALETSEPQWLVTQIARSQVFELQRAVEAGHAKLVGLAHPLAASVLAAIDSGDSIDEMLAELDYQHFLNDSSSLATFANHWAEFLALNTVDQALLLRLDTARSRLTPQSLGASLAFVAACSCGLSHLYMQRCVAFATKSASTFEKQISEIDASAESLKSVEATLAQTHAQLTKTNAGRSVAEQKLLRADRNQKLQNVRWSSLLDALASCANETCWVRRIESSANAVSVSGIAISHESANQFASVLESTLLDCGWNTAPVTASIQQNGLVHFEIALHACDASDGAAIRTKFVSRQSSQSHDSTAPVPTVVSP